MKNIRSKNCFANARRAKKLFFYAHVAMALILLGACSLDGPMREDPKAPGYKLGTLPPRWQTRKFEDDADVAFQNTADGAVLAVNSVCHRYQDSSLSALTKQLLVPMQDVKVASQDNETLDGRDALVTRATGKVDGAPVEMLVVVLRKDQCLFDFTLSAFRQIRGDDEKDFRSFVKAFRFDDGPQRKGT